MVEEVGWAERVWSNDGEIYVFGGLTIGVDCY